METNQLDKKLSYLLLTYHLSSSKDLRVSYINKLSILIGKLYYSFKEKF